MLFFCIDIYSLCIFIICDEQTFHYSNKVWFILKNATQICSLYHIRMPQILMLKLRPTDFYIKVNNHVHQDLQKIVLVFKISEAKDFVKRC